MQILRNYFVNNVMTPQETVPQTGFENRVAIRSLIDLVMNAFPSHEFQHTCKPVFDRFIDLLKYIDAELQSPEGESLALSVSKIKLFAKLCKKRGLVFDKYGYNEWNVKADAKWVIAFLSMQQAGFLTRDRTVAYFEKIYKGQPIDQIVYYLQKENLLTAANIEIISSVDSKNLRGILEAIEILKKGPYCYRDERLSQLMKQINYRSLFSQATFERVVNAGKNAHAEACALRALHDLNSDLKTEDNHQIIVSNGYGALNFLLILNYMHEIKDLLTQNNFNAIAARSNNFDKILMGLWCILEYKRDLLTQPVFDALLQGGAWSDGIATVIKCLDKHELLTEANLKAIVKKRGESCRISYALDYLSRRDGLLTQANFDLIIDAGENSMTVAVELANGSSLQNKGAYSPFSYS